MPTENEKKHTNSNPMFTRKIDFFITFSLAMLGVIFNRFRREYTELSFMEGFVPFVLLIIIITLFLQRAGKKWRKKKQLES